MSQYGIKKVYGIRILDPITKEELPDIRDKKPKENKTDFSRAILDLVKGDSPSYELSAHPLFKQYGYDTFGSICECWYWRDCLDDAPELDLWRLYAMMQADNSDRYSHLYHKGVYDRRRKERSEK